MPKETIRTIGGHKYRYLEYWDADKKKRVRKSLGRLPDDIKADDVNVNMEKNEPASVDMGVDVEEQETKTDSEAEKTSFNQAYEKGMADAAIEYQEKITEIEKQHAEAITRAKDEEYKRGHEAGREYWYNLGQKETEQKYSIMYQTQIHALESKYNELVNNLHLKYQEKEKQFEQDRAKARSMVEQAKKVFSDAERLRDEAKHLLDENVIMHGIAYPKKSLLHSPHT